MDTITGPASENAMQMNDGMDIDANTRGISTGRNTRARGNTKESDTNGNDYSVCDYNCRGGGEPYRDGTEPESGGVCDEASDD